MRHNKKFNHLGRKASHRASMLSNMAVSLIEHKRITTTLQKAKELRKYVEPLITKAKDDTTASRRVVFSYLQNKFAITELFGTVANKVGDRPGGYTRIIKLGKRRSDDADMAFIELVDFDENMAKDTKKKRTRRSSKKAAPKAETPAAPKEEAVEAPKEEVAEAPKAEAPAETAEAAE
ncbi:MAG: 50S ribosomal protein L17 [Bacteroidaceae bacterium]|jgi:large subunit ribosomal protein L17|nr:50S ribosomal protein L17 [Bacteroidaceae bacterium]